MPASVRPLVSSKSSYGVATVSRSDKIRARGGAPPRGHGMLPRAIRVGPNEGDTKIGGGVIREFIWSNYAKSGVYLIFRLKFRGFIITPRILGLKIR